MVLIFRPGLNCANLQLTSLGVQKHYDGATLNKDRGYQISASQPGFDCQITGNYNDVPFDKEFWNSFNVKISDYSNE